MLFSSEIIEAVAESLETVKIPVVVDPVMVATSGAKLLRDDALALLQQKIFPLADWLTPNIPEAEYLTGLKIHDEDTCWAAVKSISEKWHTSVILKGGHAENPQMANDYIQTVSGKRFLLSAERIQTQPYASHGTGCTLSAAMTALIALGKDVPEILTEAKTFVLESLRQSRFAGTEENQIHVMFPPQKTESHVEIFER